MFRTVTIIAFIFLTSIGTFSQTRQIDSLKKIASKPTKDTVSIKAFYLIAQELAEYNVDTAMYYAFQSYHLSKKLKHNYGTCLSSQVLGTLLMYKGENFKAINYLKESLGFADLIGDKDSQAFCNNVLGLIFMEVGEYPKALEHLLTALKIEEHLKDSHAIAVTESNIGLIYENIKKFEEALKYYFLAANSFEKSGNKANQAACYSNMSSVYLHQNKIEKGLDYNTKAITIKQDLGDTLDEHYAVMIGALGKIYGLKNDYTKAHTLFAKAIDICLKGQYYTTLALNYNNLGELNMEEKKFVVARSYFDKATKLSKQINNKEQIQDSFWYLFRLDSAMGRSESALSNYKIYIMYRDSLFNEEKTEEITKQKLQFDFNKKTIADSLKVAEEKKMTSIQLKQEKTQRFALYAGLILVLIFAGFMVNRFRVTNKQKKIISEQKHIVEEKHKEITDSINYAERIQRSFLATKELLDENLKEYFVLFKPKDVVSGDFYWASVLNNGNFAFATADSTGHGVPGAIMSLLNITSIEKAIEHNTDPSGIMNETRKIIINRLKKDGSVDGGKDGMDCSLCVYDLKNGKLFVSAANNPVWVVRQSEIIEIKPDKMPVGKHDLQDISFTQHEIDLQKGDIVYTLTDGFPDQFGGEKGKKFMTKKLRELILSNSHLPLTDQKDLLQKTFAEWVGNLEQIDDVTIVGIKI